MSMFSMKLKPSALQTLNNLPLVANEGQGRKTSLGDVHTLLGTGFIERERRGIPDNYYRLSIGIEDPDDIIADFKRALEKV